MFVVLILVLRLLVGILLIVLWCAILGSVFGFLVWLRGLCCFSVCLIVIVASVLLLVYACEFLVVMLVAHMVYWLVWVLGFALALWVRLAFWEVVVCSVSGWFLVSDSVFGFMLVSGLLGWWWGLVCGLFTVVVVIFVVL